MFSGIDSPKVHDPLKNFENGRCQGHVTRSFWDERKQYFRQFFSEVHLVEIKIYLKKIKVFIITSAKWTVVVVEGSRSL